MVMEGILTACVVFVVIYALFKGCSININVSVKQEFCKEDRQLLEDFFNKEGEFKDNKYDVSGTFDEIVKNVNDIMLGVEDETNG